LNETEALAASRLEMLREINNPWYLKKCPYCFGGPVVGWKIFSHTADCELKKELGDKP